MTETQRTGEERLRGKEICREMAARRTNPFQMLLDAWQPPSVEAGMEPIPGKTYLADGYKYFDMTHPLNQGDWTAWLDYVGAENLVPLAITDRAGTRRGQFLVSPLGMEKINDAGN